MPKPVSNAEASVLARLEADALYNALTADEKREADLGMKWATTFGSVRTSSAPKPRGRPAGSRTRREAILNGEDKEATT